MTEGQAAGLLVSRSLHREQIANQSVGLGIPLLLLITTIRLGANIGIAIDISARGGAVDWVNICFWHVVLLSLLTTWTVTPAGGIALSYHRDLGVPVDPGRLSRFEVVLIRSHLLRPGPIFLLLWVSLTSAAGVYLAVGQALGIGQATAIGLSVVAGAGAGVVMPAWLVTCSVAGQYTLLRGNISTETMRLLQVAGMVGIMAMGPDVGPGPQGVSMFLSRRVPPTIWAVPAAACAPLLILLPGLVGRLSPLFRRNTFAVRRKIRRPMLRLYAVLTFRIWLLLLLVLVILLVSGGISQTGRLWWLFGWVVVSAATGVGALTRADVVLSSFWNGSLLNRSTRRVLALPGIAHCLLMLPGVVALVSELILQPV